MVLTVLLINIFLITSFSWIYLELKFNRIHYIITNYTNKSSPGFFFCC
jgi:hypothetical protein